MLSPATLAIPPGFFSFRWQTEGANAGFEDIAMVFKVPGSIDMAVLPDLFENVCRGPIVPHAMVLVHLRGDSSLTDALKTPSVEAAMLRFDGRLPLMLLSIDVRTFELRLSVLQGKISKALLSATKRSIDSTDSWIRAGLSALFDLEKVVVTAPAGYAFQKPSSARSSYFIRADQALTTSGGVSFVALTILHRLLLAHKGMPTGLKLILVDSMSVAPTAFALRELFAHAGVSPLPQIESFHSYGGMNNVGVPMPGASLCIISASSSMNLHREWVATKRVNDRDVLTLLTFEDAQHKEHALFRLPTSAKPLEIGSNAKYDIRIAGENFFPVNEPPRKVLLTTTHHACTRLTNIYHDLRGQHIFDIYRGTESSRRGLFIDAAELLACLKLQHWVNSKMPHWLKAGTTQVVFQADDASKVLARHIAHILVQLGLPTPSILAASNVSKGTINSGNALVAVAAVANRGNALLTLSRELRNIHQGPRLYVIGAQVALSEDSMGIFDKNLKHSASGACIDVLRMQICLMDDAVKESFQLELKELYSPRNATEIPVELATRAANLRLGIGRTLGPVLLPTSHNLSVALPLSEGFAFWPKGYAAGVYQAEVLGTLAAILQNARTSTDIATNQRLRTPMLAQVALDPENFARFNDGILQACLLRASLPSELDYRGDIDASNYMRVFLERMAYRMGIEHQPELEFLTALAIGRLRLTSFDLAAVVAAFEISSSGTRTPLSNAVRFLLQHIQTLQSNQSLIAF